MRREGFPPNSMMWTPCDVDDLLKINLGLALAEIRAVPVQNHLDLRHCCVITNPYTPPRRKRSRILEPIHIRAQ
jgi:hypothetical protein